MKHEDNSPDWLTEANARLMAERINGYWRSKGFDSAAHAEPQRDAFKRANHREERVWVVRSTMRNGKPVVQKIDG